MRHMKEKRQQKIIELISIHDIETQEELAGRLKEAGYRVTQATVSRDIRELKLTKLTTATGRQKYAVFGQATREPAPERYVRLLQESLLTMNTAQNILVIKTGAGMAMAAAAALDALHLEEVIGCIAGDDTIFCAVTGEAAAQHVMQALRNLTK